jgi:hypothetical protein
MQLSTDKSFAVFYKYSGSRIILIRLRLWAKIDAASSAPAPTFYIKWVFVGQQSELAKEILQRFLVLPMFSRLPKITVVVHN